MNCVHLDFHTSPDIDKIGEKFDKAEFAKTLKEANVDLITVFAKCHHGYTYYPSKVSTMHPGLKFNLVKEEVEAAHSVGVKAPIYITVGWSKKDADEHPEWHHINFDGTPRWMGKLPEDENAPLPDCTWMTLCPVGGYMEHLEAITREVCQNFDVTDGIFYDICFNGNACVCPDCSRGMREMGLDPTNLDDAKRYFTKKRVWMMQHLTGIVHEYAKDAPVFYNGGASMNNPQFHPYQSHYELEDLPTAWGGYDLMPVRAKFFEKYGKHFLGMTGKFHHAWGEFGGFKNKDALKYECADMLSVGASISIGDHLHPSGKMDKSTYATIGHAFEYSKKIEKFSENTEAYTDLAIWLGESDASNMAASKILQIMHLEYDVITSGDDISKYSCIVLPDKVKFSEGNKKNLVDFVTRGGRLVASYESIFDELGIEKIEPSAFDMDYIQCDLGDYTTPFLAYSSAYKVKAEGEVMAKVYEPYFSRTAKHFCGHKNTPNKTEPEDYPALIKVGGVVYFAHPVFEAYEKSGNYVLENYIIKGILSVYDPAITTEELPSCGRVRLRKSKDGDFLALHLLYAPPVNRGNVCLLPDFPKLHDVKVNIKVNKTITSAHAEPDGEAIPFTQSGNTVTLSIPPFRLHKLVILK